MCGIFACHKCYKPVVEFKATALQLSKAIRHRGPDWSGNVVKNNTILCHERLAVVGVGTISPSSSFLWFIDELVDSGAQPIVNANQTLILGVNGEIYNHRALRKSLKKSHAFKTHSDCEVILHLVLTPRPSYIHYSTKNWMLNVPANSTDFSVSYFTTSETDETESSQPEIQLASQRSTKAGSHLLPTQYSSLPKSNVSKTSAIKSSLSLPDTSTTRKPARRPGGTTLPGGMAPRRRIPPST
jgi:Glutamine amidotransferase domain